MTGSGHSSWFMTISPCSPTNTMRLLLFAIWVTGSLSYSNSTATESPLDNSIVQSSMETYPDLEDDLEEIDTPVHFPVEEILGECLLKMSWPCVQKKTLVFVDKLNRKSRLRVLGDYLSLVKVSDEYTPPITEALLTSRKIQDQGTLWDLLDLLLDKFVSSHVIRITLPGEERDVESRSFDLDFSTPKGTAVFEGRGKKGGGKGGGGMMKMMGMMMLGKMAMMIPIAMAKGMMGGLAGMMSLAMSKMIMMMKMMKSCKGSGCGGGPPPPPPPLAPMYGAPSPSYGAPPPPPPPPSQSYGVPSGAGPPPAPSQSYGVPSMGGGPSAPSQSYGAPSGGAPPPPPSQSYGAPSGGAPPPPPSQNYGAPSGGAPPPPQQNNFAGPSNSIPPPTNSYGPPSLQQQSIPSGGYSTTGGQSFTRPQDMYGAPTAGGPPMDSYSGGGGSYSGGGGGGGGGDSYSAGGGGDSTYSGSAGWGRRYTPNYYTSDLQQSSYNPELVAKYRDD